MRFSLLALAVLALSACCSLSPQPVVTAPEQLLATDCKAALAPSIRCADVVTGSFDAKNQLWLAWSQAQHVYVQHRDSESGVWSQPVTVNAEPEPIIAHGENRPKVKTDAQSGVYVSWSRSLEKRHTAHIRFSRSLDGGQQFTAPVTVNDNLDVIGHSFDSLEVGPNGEVLVVWLDGRDKEKAKASKQEHLGSSVFYSVSTDRGEHFMANQRLAQHSCECCRIATTLDQQQHPVIVWRHVFDGGIRDHALLRFNDWQTPGQLERLSQENWKIDACPHHGPAIAIADSGRAHSVWFSAAEGKQGLYYAYNDHDQQSTPLQFGEHKPQHPHIAVLGNQVVIVWMEFDGQQTRVLSMRSSDAGQHFSSTKQVAETAQKADYAFVLTDQSDFYLSWLTEAEGYRLLKL